MIVFLVRLRHRVARFLAYGKRTGATRWNGEGHRQPRAWRKAWCRLRGRHRIKFSTYPRGSCPACEWWPHG